MSKWECVYYAVAVVIIVTCITGTVWVISQAESGHRASCLEAGFVEMKGE